LPVLPQHSPVSVSVWFPVLGDRSVQQRFDFTLQGGNLHFERGGFVGLERWRSRRMNSSSERAWFTV
jgi:hypothetical protein